MHNTPTPFQWCEDKLAALPHSLGVHPLYDDFSTPCYDGEHHIIMGGSFISTGDEASVFARFHFRPHFFQQAGFRVVSSSGALDGNACTLIHALQQLDATTPPRLHVAMWACSSRVHAHTKRTTGPLQTSCMDSPGPHVGSWDPSVTCADGDKAKCREADMQRRLLLHYGGEHLLPAGVAGTVPQTCTN